MFGKPQAIVYLRRKSLELYLQNSQSYAEKLDYPADLVSSEEILNDQSFGRFLGDFFTKVTSAGQRFVVILSDELTFSQIIEVEKSKDGDLEAQKKEFFDSVPLDTHELATLEFYYKNRLFLAGCNKKLYEDVVLCLTNMGRTVDFVVPAFVFGVSANAPLTGDDISKILSNHDLIKLSNLLSPPDKKQKVESGSDAWVPDTKVVSGNRNESDDRAFDMKYFFVPVLVIVVAAALMGGYLLFSAESKSAFRIDLPFFAKAKQVASPSPAASAAAEEKKITDKGAMSVEVINGTGVVGQAGKVKTMLEGIGFSNITAANAENTGNTVTKVEYSSDIDRGVREEVEAELKKTFEQVESSDAGADSTYQIIVTTGVENNP